MGLIFNLHPIHFCRCLSFIFIRSLKKKKLKIADFLSRCRGQMRSFIASLLLSSCVSVYPSVHASDYIISRVSGKSARPLTEGKERETSPRLKFVRGVKKKQGLRHSVSTNFHCEATPPPPVPSTAVITPVSKRFHQKMCYFTSSHPKRATKRT